MICPTLVGAATGTFVLRTLNSLLKKRVPVRTDCEERAFNFGPSRPSSYYNSIASSQVTRTTLGTPIHTQEYASVRCKRYHAVKMEDDGEAQDFSSPSPLLFLARRVIERVSCPRSAIGQPELHFSSSLTLMNALAMTSKHSRFVVESFRFGILFAQAIARCGMSLSYPSR